MRKHTYIDSVRKSDPRPAPRRGHTGSLRQPTDRRRPDRERTIGAIDLFCGAGGLTKGLSDAGVQVRLGIDLDEACQYPYETNNPGAQFILGDVAKLTTKELVGAWAGIDVRVLAGCAPCQPFSSYTQGQPWKRTDQWSLLRAFAKLIETSKPDIVTMENVASLARHNVFRKFCKSLTNRGFHVVWDVLDCRNFGIPQSRRRLVLIASRLGQPELPRATHPDPKKWRTVREVIGGLPAIKAGRGHPVDPLHVSSDLTPINLKRIRASKPGGTWRDWPAKLIAECHTRKKGKTYPGVYGRMQWDAPGPTITGQSYGYGNGRFGHPAQDRAISLREAALLQSFPALYSFVPPQSRVKMLIVGQLIGNAVPPRLGRVIGVAIRKHVQQAAINPSRRQKPSRRVAT